MVQEKISKEKVIQNRVANEKVVNSSAQSVLSEDKLSTNITKKKILVVDDEEGVRRLIEKYLLRKGHEIITASHGKEALEKIKKNKFDLIITDLRMPVMDGFQLFEEIKETFPEIKICLMTGDFEVNKIEHMMENGAKGIVKKPFGLDELEVLVTQALSEKSE